MPLTNNPAKMPVRRADMPAPAPVLTENDRCSNCNVKAISAGNGEMKVCPSCYAMLWSMSWSPTEHQLIAQRMAAERRAKRVTVKMSGKPVEIDSPILGTPTLTENDG